MSMLPRVLLLALRAAQAAGAADPAPAPVPAVPAPTAASVKELITLTESRKLVDEVPGQVESAMQSAMQEAFGSEDLTPPQQKIVDDMGAKATALFKQEMGWGVLEPLFIAVYTKTFTQPEIDGMIAFYKSEAGHAVIAKMPLVMQNTMELVQERMMTLEPKLQQLQQDALEQLQATGKEDTPAPK